MRVPFAIKLGEEKSINPYLPTHSKTTGSLS